MMRTLLNNFSLQSGECNHRIISLSWELQWNTNFRHFDISTQTGRQSWNCHRKVATVNIHNNYVRWQTWLMERRDSVATLHPSIFRQTVTELYTELNVTIITNNNQTLKHQLFLRLIVNIIFSSQDNGHWSVSCFSFLMYEYIWKNWTVEL